MPCWAWLKSWGSKAKGHGQDIIKNAQKCCFGARTKFKCTRLKLKSIKQTYKGSVKLFFVDMWFRGHGSIRTKYGQNSNLEPQPHLNVPVLNFHQPNNYLEQCLKICEDERSRVQFRIFMQNTLSGYKSNRVHTAIQKFQAKVWPSHPAAVRYSVNVFTEFNLVLPEYSRARGTLQKRWGGRGRGCAQSIQPPKNSHTQEIKKKSSWLRYFQTDNTVKIIYICHNRCVKCWSQRLHTYFLSCTISPLL